jgi:hypothetical protein
MHTSAALPRLSPTLPDALSAEWSTAMKPTSAPPSLVTSVSFLQRARHYRLAAAISDAPRDVKMFLDLAPTMFELLSEQFARAEARLQPVRA